MSETRLTSCVGEMNLQRLPRRRRELLRAWDAADEYLLQAYCEQAGLLADKPLLICNDGFGALSVSLSRKRPRNWSDSWLAQEACRQNLVANGCAENAVEFVPSTDLPGAGSYQVLFKVPKSMALMEDQLIRLKPLLQKDSCLLVAGMSKNMPAKVWTLLERIVGPCETSRAVKKAKLIRVQPDMSLGLPENPYPVSWKLPATDITLLNHANVFSRDQLDIGTRFLLQHAPHTQGEGVLVDLGCGNGVLGLMAAKQNAQLKVHFVDESYMAIASARQNFKQVDARLERAQFHCTDGLHDFAAQSVDLILCNPPFHQAHSVGDTVALSMFRQSARVLHTEGELWVVGNRHLGYHHKLRKWFSSVELVSSNRKFVILKASHPRPKGI